MIVRCRVVVFFLLLLGGIWNSLAYFSIIPRWWNFFRRRTYTRNKPMHTAVYIYVDHVHRGEVGNMPTQPSGRPPRPTSTGPNARPPRAYKRRTQAKGSNAGSNADQHSYTKKARGKNTEANNSANLQHRCKHSKQIQVQPPGRRRNNTRPLQTTKKKIRQRPQD